MEASPRYPRIGSHRDVEAFRRHLAQFGPEVPVDPEILRAPDSPLAQPLEIGGLVVGNRWCVQPMEGWDGERDGNPSEFTVRRWRHFGESGAKLIWGGEAVAVRPDGRANPNQLLSAEHTRAGLERLRSELLEAHRKRFGSTEGLLVGLQLTHSGRFSRPNAKDRPEPRIAFRHPILDARAGVEDESAVLTDAEIEAIIEDFVRAARRAQEAGFDFVDIKHCHGYLLNEFLAARDRQGPYGGPFENRTRPLREIVRGIRRDAPGLEIAVRVSIFDVVPYKPSGRGGRGPGPGVPDLRPELVPYRWGFGVDPEDPVHPSLEEGVAFLELLRELGIRLVNISGGSPYYNPHVQRPALYPPCDGYEPPEDPLRGVVRHLRVCRDLKKRFPDLVIVGSALSYLQDYLPHTVQAVVREGWMDSAGIGRMALTYWDLPADALEKGRLDRKRICRTFSDCTTGPRLGLQSGCYPLDPFYRDSPLGKELRRLKRGG